MKFKVCFLLLLICFLVPQAAMPQQNVYRSWFTAATATEFENYDYSPGAAQFSAPGSAPSSIAGTRGDGIDLTSYAPADAANARFAVGAMATAHQNGCISFWIKPNEDGKLPSGGSEHYLLEAGSPAANGFRISWDNSKGTIRFMMSNAGGKTTVCRADISAWQANEWHHVQVNWYYRNNCGKGLAVFIDRVCIASCIMGADTFMAPPSQNYVKLGGLYGTASTYPNCYMDELIFRTGVNDDSYIFQCTPVCYRDYFLTAPYTEIKITQNQYGETDPYSTGDTKEVLSLAADDWVLKSTTGVNARIMKKQYGVIAKKRLTHQASSETYAYEYITNFEDKPGGYNVWGEFDAKPNISWTVLQQGTGGLDTSITTGANGGLVTGGTVPVTDAEIIADFRGLYDRKTLVVKEWEAKPDLGIQYIERWPRYNKADAQKWPGEGEMVFAIVHFGNFGTSTITADFQIKYEWATDTNNNFRIDGAENWTTIAPVTHTYTADINAGVHDLTDYVTWNWPTGDPLGVDSVFLRVTLDPTNTVTSEICDVNNQRCEKSNARAFQWGYHHNNPELDGQGNQIYPVRHYFHEDYDNRAVNLIGSFSDYDWYNAHIDRVNIMLRTTRWDTIDEIGIRDGLRVDLYTAWTGDTYTEWEANLPVVDGGFPELELNGGCTRLTIHNGVMHEIGHNILWQADLYCSQLLAGHTLLGSGVGGSVDYPVVNSYANPATSPGTQLGMWTSTSRNYVDEYGTGYTSFMDANHFWLSRFEAGWVHWTRQYRPREQPRFTEIMPGGAGNNRIQFYTIDDTPLCYARIWVYQAIQSPRDLYVPNWPKFDGASDLNTGVFTFPTTTSGSWDNWNSDTVEKNTDSFNNPFDRNNDPIDLWPNYRHAEHLLIKIIGKDPRNTSVDKVEYHLLPAIELANQFFRNSLGGSMRDANGSPGTPGTIVIRTSLANAYGPGAASPAAQTLNTNTAPIARVKYGGITHTSDFSIDVPANTDFTLDGTFSTDPEGQPLYYFWDEVSRSDPSARSGTWTLNQSTSMAYDFYVIDGVRFSNTIRITVNIQ